MDDRSSPNERDADTATGRSSHAGPPSDDAMQPRWLQLVNAAMDLPADEGRAVLDEIATRRRERADELRARAEREDTTAEHRKLFGGMAAWVDDSVDLVEQARDRLAEIEARDDVATGREQIERETGRGWSM